MPHVVAQAAFTLAFDRTTGTPIALLVGSRGDVIRGMHVVITDGFNDPGATISIGTELDAEAIVPAADIAAQVAGEYARTGAYRLASARYVYLFIRALTSTSGRGVVSWATATGIGV